MARYGQDFERYGRGSMDRYGGMEQDYDADFGGRFGPGGYGGPGGPGGYGGGGGIGGMRSDPGGHWRDFPGEEGWYGGRAPSREARYGGEGYGGGRYGRDYGPGGYGGAGGGREERGRVRAADIMTDNPEAVTPEATLAEAAQKMRDLDVGIIPVVESRESRRLRGVITDRDIAVRAVAEGLDAKATKVSQVMTKQVETVNKNDTVHDVLWVMQREQVRRVPVTDREGRLVGIIAQADVATDFADEGTGRKRMFADTVERISEPGEPERGRGGQKG